MNAIQDESFLKARKQIKNDKIQLPQLPPIIGPRVIKMADYFKKQKETFDDGNITPSQSSNIYLEKKSNVNNVASIDLLNKDLQTSQQNFNQA